MKRLVAILLPLFLLPACGADDVVTEPASGAIRVIVATTGDAVATGYTVNVGMTDRSVSVNGSVTFGTLLPGAHEIQLNAVPTNCVVSGANPRSAEVVAGETVEVTFDVACASGKPDDPDGPDGPQVPA